MSQEKDCWTQFHLSTAHQRESKGVCADISQTDYNAVWTQQLMASLLDGRMTCPAPEPSLKCQGRCSDKDHARWPGSYKHFHLAAIERRPKQYELQKMSLFFPVVLIQRQLCLTLLLRSWWAKGTWCAWLPFGFPPSFSVFDILWHSPLFMSVHDRQLYSNNNVTELQTEPHMTLCTVTVSLSSWFA